MAPRAVILYIDGRKNRMRRHLIIAVLGLGLAVLLVALFWPKPERLPSPGESGSQAAPVAQTETPAIEPAPIGPLAMTGRVVDFALRPLAGVEVACGDETAVSGVEGSFE